MIDPKSNAANNAATDAISAERKSRAAICIAANAQRSHAGPMAFECKPDGLPALADACSWAPLSCNVNQSK